MSKNGYYTAKGIYLANALSFITGQKPYVFDDVNNPGYQVYSFIYNKELQEALDVLNNARKKLYKK